MKTKIILALIAISTFSGCTRVLYTHEQVMARYQTKDQIIAKFGLPAEKRQGENLEEWIYNFGTISQSRGGAVAYRGIIVTNGQYDNSLKYIKFTFDGKGNLLKWESQGVNLTEKKVSTGKTIVGIVLGLALCIGLGIALGESGQTL